MNPANTASHQAGKPVRLDDAQRISMAQSAFEKYYTRCFWFMEESLTVTSDLLPRIIDGLRQNGDREAFLIADRLCR